MSEQDDPKPEAQEPRSKKTFDVRAPRVSRSTKDSVHFQAEASRPRVREAVEGGAQRAARPVRRERQRPEGDAREAGRDASSSEPRAERPEHPRPPSEDKPTWQRDRRLVPVRPGRERGADAGANGPEERSSRREERAAPARSAELRATAQPDGAREERAKPTTKAAEPRSSATVPTPAAATPEAPQQRDLDLELAIAAAPRVIERAKKQKDKPRTAKEALRAKTAKAQAAKASQGLREADSPSEPTEGAAGDEAAATVEAVRPRAPIKQPKKGAAKPKPQPEAEEAEDETELAPPKLGFWQRVKSFFGG